MQLPVKALRLLLFPLVCLIISGMVPGSTDAQVPNVLSYDGYLTNTNGQPLNGRRDLTFVLYATPTGGAPVWQETHQNVAVNGGVFRVVLGRGTVPQPLTIPFDQQYYLGVRVGNDPEMSPRQELMPSAYSFRAKTAESVPDTSIGGDKLKPLSISDEKIRSVSWSKITGVNEGVSARIWSLQGNRNTDPTTDFLGTVDNQDLIFRTNNMLRMMVHSSGNVDINSNLLALGSITSRTSPTEGAFYLGESNFGLRRMGGSNNVELFSNTGNLFLTGGNIGIGTVIPSAKLHVAGNAILSGSLTSGSGHFNNTLRVNGHTTLSTTFILGDLHASGSANLGMGNFSRIATNGDLYVNEHAIINTYARVNDNLFAGSVAVGTDTPQVGLHVRWEAGSGAPNDLSKYVAVLENSSDGAQTHGLAVKLSGRGGNAGDRVNNSNNFVTFFNRSEISGRIEGETVGENLAQPDYINEAATIATKFIIQCAFSWKEWGGFLQGLADIASFGVKTGFRVAGAGVTYASGAGDYAECLLRLDENETIVPGDVVGVFGGKVSRKTRGAERIMAVSSNPIVLGNMPEQSKEHLYEKVAFLGQIPVTVVGSVGEGDYIIPSGRDDGTAIAVSPRLMTAAEFPKVLGRAWGASPNPFKKFVNVAVGLHAGDMAPVVQRTERSIAELRSRVDATAELLALTQAKLERLESMTTTFGTQQEDLVQLKAAVMMLQQRMGTPERTSDQEPHSLSAVVAKE